MSSFPSYQKKITMNVGEGADQLGNVIGTPKPGDVVKCHMKASYTAVQVVKPMFSRTPKTKTRHVEFLSTHMVGDTCFVEATIPAPSKQHPTSANEVLAKLFETMPLGECAQFVLDMNSMDPTVRNMLVTEKLRERAQYGTVPNDATHLTFEINSFRIIREQKEYRCKNRFGTGAKMPGSYSMGM